MARGIETTSTVAKREQRTQDLLDQLHAEGDPGTRHEITEEVALTNLPLCDALASRYARRGSEHDDLVQVARVGLLLAIDRFRPGEDRTFAKFAVPTITGELKRYFRDCCWTVRPPRTVQELRPRVEAARTRLVQELRREPSEAELAERVEASSEAVTSCLTSATSYRPISLDVPVHQGSWASLGDAIGADNPDVGDVTDRIDLQRALAALTRRERQVVAWRFCDDLTQAEIGERLGVSQMQISRILRGVLGRLRTALSPELPRAA